MKVLYIDHYAGSDTMGMEFRPHYLARAWRRQGVETTILAADFSHLRQKNPIIRQDLEEKTVDGSRFIFLKAGSYQGNGKDRVLSMVRFVAKGIKYAKKLAETIRPDVVITSSTYPMDTYLGQRIAKLASAKLIHEIHDLWPLSPMYLGGYSKNHPFIRVMQAAENSAYRNSDLVVSILPNIEPHVRGLGFNVPVVHIPNGLPPEAFPRPGAEPIANEGVKGLVEKLKGQGKYLVGYAGGISVSNAMGDFVRAMAKIKDRDDIAAILIGKGILSDSLAEYKEKKGLSNVYFLDPIPKAEVIGSLRLCDALYLGSQPSPLYQYGVSANKIYDYLLAGRPIINAWDTNHSPLDQLGNTIKAKAADEASIAQAILASQKLTAQDRQKIEEDSQAFVRTHHHYDKLAMDFLHLFA